MSNRADKYARKGSTERFGVGETAGGKTAEEWGQNGSLGLARIRDQEALHSKEGGEAALEAEGE